jgi:membrane protein DedA with SNARE-associated domain
VIVLAVGFIVMSNVGDALAPRLVDTHPLTLIALNSRNRNLILATNQLDALGYYVVGTLRLLASDPLFFLLGYWYGDGAIRWMERRTRTLGQTMRQWEGWFSKAAYPCVFVLPNQYICLFAGAAGMSVPGFFAVNLAGTFTRLYLIRRLGEAFDAPINDVLHFIGDYRTPLLIASVLIVSVMAFFELRKGSGEIDALIHLDDELGDAPADHAGTADDGAEPPGEGSATPDDSLPSQ